MCANLFKSVDSHDTSMQIDTSPQKSDSTNKPFQKITSLNILTSSDSYLDDELAILEFQGDFENSETAEFDTLPLGILKDCDKGNFELKVGNHLLKGKAIDLPKPLLMTEKVINTYGEPEFIIKGVVKKKIMFTGRPTPLRTAATNGPDLTETKQRKVQ